MLEFGPGKPSWKNLVRRFLMHQVPVLKPDNGHVVHAIAAKFPKSQVNAFDPCPHILEVSDDHDDALDAMATEWRAEDRARLISEKKGKRKFPESRRYDDKIIALVDGALVPQADFPTAGAYVVSDYQWEGEEKITGWRYVADATRLDDPAEIAGAA